MANARPARTTVLKRQFDELNEMVHADPRKLALVRHALQAIIDGRFSSPPWFTQPEIQITEVARFLERYGRRRKGFRKSDIPRIPSFFPQSLTEVPLLTVTLPDDEKGESLQNTVEAWWEFLSPPPGCVKWRDKRLETDPEHLRVGSEREPPPGIRWVAFDPCRAVLKYDSARKNALEIRTRMGLFLAQAEVLMAAALFPNWTDGWNGTSSLYPNLSGLESRIDGDVWRDEIALRRWGGGRLEISSVVPSDAGSVWWPCTVRPL